MTWTVFLIIRVKKFDNKNDFIIEIFKKFENLNKNYLQKLDELLEYFFASKKTFTQNFDEKINENKKKVSSIRKLILQAMKKQFSNFKKQFQQLCVINEEKIQKSLNQFNKDNIQELQQQLKIFKNDYKEYKNIIKKHESSRKYYFDYINNLDSIELHYLKNYNSQFHKSIQYINKKQWQLFKITQQNNSFFCDLSVNFYDLMQNYQIICKKNFQFQFDLVNWFDINCSNDNDQTQTLIRKFQLVYKDPQLNYYLNNLHLYRLKFYDTNQTIKYKYSQNNPKVKQYAEKIRVYENTDKCQDMVDDIKLFLLVIIFDFKIIKQNELQNLIDSIDSNLQYFDFLVLNLNLLIQYEQKKLYLAPHCFIVLKRACNKFVNSCQYSYETNYNIQMIKSFFEVASQIFEKNKISSNNSLLQQMNFEIIQNNPNFWQIFYNHIIKENFYNSINYKQKQLCCIEKCIYYHQFFSQDIFYSKNYMLEVFIRFQINARYIDLDRIIYKTSKFQNNQKNSKSVSLQNYQNTDQKIKIFLTFFIKKAFYFFDFEIFIKLIQLKRQLYVSNRNLILKQKILYQKLDIQLKLLIWLFLTKSQSGDQKLRKLSLKSQRQIQMDVVRTKSISQPQELPGKIQVLLQCFFENNEQKLDYFQGFNYIANFVYSLFQNHDDSLQIMRFVAKNVLQQFFTEDLATKIDELNFISQKIVEKYFQQLYIHWQNEQIEINHLFQGYFVSLFTNLDSTYNEIVFNFWNFILFVFQKEKLGGLFFVFLLYH